MSLGTFEKFFYPEYTKLTNDLNELNENEPSNKSRDELIKSYDQLSNRIQTLQAYFTDYTTYLSTYEQRKALEHLNKLSQHASQVRNKIFPKKKFEFKSKKNLNTEIKIENQNIKNEIINNNDRSDQNDTSSIATHTCTICNMNNEIIRKNEDEIFNADIGIFNIENCTIELKGTPSFLHIKNVKNSTILCGPLNGTAFISDVSDSKFNLACHQLRIHDTVNTDFYINVSSRTIIENCKGIRFAPYAWSYKNIEKHYSNDKLGLNLKFNDTNSMNIDDFNWLVSTQESPNWSFIDINERLKWSDDN